MNVVIAGGGTGGHLFPGIAVAQEWRRQDPQTQILFLGSPHGIEVRVLPTYGFPLKTLAAKGFKGKNILQQCAALAAVPVAFLQALRYVKDAHADIVVGLGGYSSFPAITAAYALGIPTAIHEQNSVPGLANRLLGIIADAVFVSFEESRAYFPAAKTTVTGLPVREEFGRHATTCKDRFCLCVCGGSQGARAINTAMAQALPALRDRADRIYVLHQSGAADCDMLKEQYAVHGIPAEVAPFVEHMAKWFSRADVVLCRAGASTLAELALSGTASVLVPYPFAAGNHQERNAQVFAKRGASILLPQRELSGERLGALLRELIDDPARCVVMGRQALTLARPHAAQDIVAACRRMVKTGKNVAR
ncbi:MAG: undecaprenyldiphospho-muramoylpentapeptide beta-N-acetylglucosaminyltransferase [Desulfobacterota bacterium]|nr:undecaprenyldiphospho-muramoylpentapeptide beta-N-acetylglucosaminyltransferase [Thermodesulfobacteriota bacterium]